MTNEDRRILLLRGKPIRLSETLYFTPPTLDAIADLGMTDWLTKIGVLFYDLNKLKHSVASKPQFADYTPFEIFSIMLNQEDETSMKLHEDIVQVLNVVTNQEWRFDKAVFLSKECIITDKEWFEIRSWVALEYGVKDDKKPEEYNLANEKAKEFKRKRDEAAKQVNEIKSKNKDEQSFFDLISAVAAKDSSLDIISVWNLTMFQLIQCLRRLSLIDNYEFSMQALLAGADSKKIEVQHWTSKT